MKISNKVYLEVLPHSKPKEVYKDVVKIKRTLEDDVEYTRTDAFIEKACKWLDENWTSFVNYNDEDGVVYYWNLTDKFKDYMKGE